MKRKKIYLDYAATTPVHPRVIKAMTKAWRKNFGNPSSQHHFGQVAQQLVDTARLTVAEFINTKSSNIIFTADATESNNLYLQGIANNLTSGGRLIVSQIEHSSVLKVAEKLSAAGILALDLAPINDQGVIDVTKFQNLLQPDTKLISTMYVDNETGVIQPLVEIRDIIRNFEKENNTKIFWHIDATQAAPYIDIDVAKLDCDALTLSSHKIYGPKGIGALYLKDLKQIQSVFYGGSHEHNLRPGTLNVPGIIGFSQACQFIKSAKYQKHLSKYVVWREYFWTNLLNIYPAAVWYGQNQNLTPAHLFFSLPGFSSESLLILLDQQGIAISAGSACSTGAIKKSQFAEALGLTPEKMKSVLRLTLGFYTTKKDIDYVLKVFKGIIDRVNVKL